MITVNIEHDGEPIGQMEITRIPEDGTDQYATYKVKYGVERGSAVGVHERTLRMFPRKHLNVLALISEALFELNAKDMSLERDFDLDKAPVSTSMVRRFDGARSIISRWFG